MSNTQIELLTDDILARFKDTLVGHCARINFLSTAEAEAICQQIASREQDTLLATHILTKQYTAKKQAPIYITVDKAIELRNRKQEKLCLFVPTDLVDAAYSSLGNSFAIVDGRSLHTRVLKRVLSQLPGKVAQFVRAAFSQLHGTLNVSDDQKLDFALAVLKHTEDVETVNAGLELWRIGLIADATIGGLLNAGTISDLEIRLGQNRHCTLALSRPLKIDATTRERIQSLKVDEQTTIRLTAFFRGQSLNNVSSWSQEIASRADLTFDCWIFPTTETSDIRSIIITPFVNVAGRVEKYCCLDQPDGDKGSLIARCGPKEKLVVKWKCEPEQPKNLNGWRVAIVPADSDMEYEGTIELPERDLPAQRRTITINMNVEFDSPPDFSVCVRVMPINKDASVIINDAEEMIYGESREFFLSKKIDELPLASTRESKFVVSTLPYGRLDYAVETKDAVLTEMEPQWSSKDLEYFSVKLNNRRMLQIGLSATLLTIERQSIANPRKNSYYLLEVDTVHAVHSQEIASYSLSGGDQDGWKAFWKARDLFFSRLCKDASRDVVEVVEWTLDLTNAALRYAQSYRELLDDLIERQEDPQQLRELLSIDTLLVRIAGRDNTVEEAIIILPIHPLRVAWFVNYTQLLLTWETQLLTLPSHTRKYNLDIQALRLLTPINVPPFSYHSLTAETFTFFQNMRFFHGVALPAGVPDPHRRYGDIAILFGMTEEQGSIGDNHPEQLAEHLKNFLELHPYTKTLVTTLVNPDRGNFFAEAIRHLMLGRKLNDDEVEQPQTPTFQIIAYTDSRHKSTLQAIGQLRQVQIDLQYQQITDQFLPGIATISRPIQQLSEGKLPEAHVAMVTDLTRPKITTLMVDELSTNGPTSFSLYGLVSRFNSQFSAEQGFLRWQHQIITEGVRKPEAHPAGSKYGELLIELHTKLLKAGGYLLSGRLDSYPALEVILTEEQRILLERLHESTNWVVTLDRFFTLDYYDSPNEPGLNALARKYVLDYSPEFTDGLGHRMMVTTAWHEEIQSLLSQAMNDLGFARVNQSVSHLLHHLKTISGRLALQVLESPTTASAAVGLGVVTAWLESKGRLKQGVLIPVDIYPRLFSLNSSGKATAGERRCDLVLISLKRNIVDATFIEVKWRRGHVPYEELSKSMVLQMKSSAVIMHNRFFDESRIDGALQRSYLANVLRFYFERSRRYKLFDPESETSFLEHVARLEKTGLDFRPGYEGYIVSLDGEERRPFPVDDARITVLTARDFEQSTEFASQISPSLESIHDISEDVSPTENDIDENDEILSSEISQSVKETFMPTVDTNKKNAEVSQNLEAQSDSSAVLNGINHDQHVEAESQPLTIPLGEATGSRLPIDWLPAIHGSPHLFILGIPGQGKSWTVTRILTELALQQVPALVLDFHGQFADPHEPFAQAAHPTVLDAAKGLPFSPFECSLDNDSNSWQANAFAVAEIFAHVVSLGDMQRDIVFSAILEVYKDHGFRDDLGLSSADLTYPTLSEVFQRIESFAQIRHSPSVVARCRPLLEMNLFRPQEQMPDLLSTIRSGLVIDLHNLYIETLQLAAGAFVLRKIYKDMFSWGYAKRIRLAIVLDEAHRLAKDVTLPKIMREGRKFGIAVIVASQGMADFHPDVLGTAGTKVIFRMNFPDSKKVSGFIRGLPGQDLVPRIEQLPVGSAYVQTPEMNIGSVVKMLPLK